jgi:hypothetical protein
MMTASFLTVFSGYSAQVPLGEICHLIMEIGTLLHYGNWNSIAKRFRRYVKQGTWEKILEALIGGDDEGFEWLIIDASFVKVHKHGCGSALLS